MRIREQLAHAVRRLRDSGSPDPESDAAWLMADALEDSSRGALALRLDETLAHEQLEWFCRALARRETGEPLQYIEGFAFFMGRKFLVDSRALIPRADTEILCEAALASVEPGARVLDLCTGSGAVAISIALGAPDARVTGADISADALALARENARRLGARVDWAQGDLFDAVAGAFDVIACNPPYLSAGDMASLQKEVAHEPALALFGGADGLDFYRRIADVLAGRLSAGGAAHFEVGAGQAQAVAERMRAIGRITITKDLGGVSRVVSVERV
jgi:release factor glutamine methyltransferase